MGGRTVTAEVALRVTSATAVAVTITLRFPVPGVVGGAVYVAFPVDEV